jgi:coenzyme F420-dependent glucose-6-phosphate dehydrogenase
MIHLGYALSSEEHTPNDLVRNAQQAEDVGFGFALISDHIHPWVDKQGHSSFVWSVIGAIAHATTSLQLGTGVTCPLIRIHPAIIAHAAATAADMMPGRFFLGVGTGENLNEHVLGHRWPPYQTRRLMLEEAIAIMRQLWEGGSQTHHGTFYTVEQTRLYTLPSEPPPIMIAAGGPSSGKLAGEQGDGLISTAPAAEVVEAFQSAGGGQKPRYGQITVCWAADEAQARRTAYEIWPNAANQGELSQELPLPAHFEQLAKMVTEDQVAESVICGPDPEPYLEAIRKYVDAGFDHIYLHQIGPDQAGFFNFCKKHILPVFAS